MRKIIVIGLILLTSSAWAEWTFLIKIENGDTYFLDLETIKKNGHLRQVWSLMEYKPSPIYGQSGRMKLEFDCEKEQYKYIYISSHSGLKATGETLESYQYKDDEWELIPPNTPMSKILKIVCNS